MFIVKGQEPFGFCPGKATWDQSLMDVFNLLIISIETGNLLYSGGIDDQPSWYIELLSEFVLRYDILKFSQKVEMVLGSDDKMNKASKNLKNSARF